MEKKSKMPVFIDRKTMLSILSQFKIHGECTIEAPEYPIVVIKPEAVGSKELWSYLWGGKEEDDTNAEATP